MKRRRYATREELEQLIDKRLDDAHAPEYPEYDPSSAVLNVLADLGVDLGALVKIEVDEDVAVHP